MTILICDVCQFQLTVGPLQSFSTERDGKRVVWDVGPCCMGKPFTVPPTARQETAERKRA
jgi:hypothetical protein